MAFSFKARQLLIFITFQCPYVKLSYNFVLQDVLADTVQDCFKDLVYIMQGDLYQSMPAFLADNDNDNEAGKKGLIFVETIVIIINN